MTRRTCFALAFSLLAMAALAEVAPSAEASGGAASADSGDQSYGMGGPGEGDFDTDLIRNALPIEIATASYYELVSMAKGLGLSGEGTVDELRKRLYEHYKIEPPAASAGKGKTITIESASEASYAKAVEEDGGIVRASGGVVLSLVDENGDSHRVEADRIAYDRATGSMTARGHVRYERKSGSSTEVFTGEALSASVEDWSGVFLDGKIRRSSGSSGGTGTASSTATSSSTSGSTASSERGVVIAADVVVKRSTDVMVLKDGVISACDAEDPHYSIKAGKIWILGDKEWALANAVFSLGNVPILWLPFFYYPGDEIVFHPVLGYRSREGRFAQTTTYLIGSKPKNTDTTTILSMVDSGPDKPTKLNGIFLRRVSGPVPKDAGTLKVMADAYSALGGFAGIQGSLPKLGALGKTELFAGVGLSRSIFTTSKGYSPFAAAGGYESVWNESNLFGLELPVRYGFDFSTSLSFGGVTLSLALPLYSDPFLDQDFRDRSEDMDWLKLFSSTDESSSSISTRTQLQPKVSATYSLKLKGLEPWLQSLNVTKLNSYVTFSTMTISDANAPTVLGESAALKAVDPRRTFYYPSVLRPFDVALSLKGSLTPGSASASTGKAVEGGAKAEGDAAAGPSPEFRSPWEDEAPGDGAEGPGAAEGPSEESSVDFRLPATFGATKSSPVGWSGTTSWSLTPSMYWEDRYREDDLSGPSDIDFARQYSLISYSLASTVDGSLSYGGGLVAGSMGFTYSKQGQDRPYLYEGSASSVAAYKLADYQAKSERVGGKASLSTKPLSGSWLWALSSLSWGMDSTIYSLKYKELSDDEPVYTTSHLGWDDSSITSHNVNLYIAARPAGLTQSLTLTASLPPTDESYSAKLALDAGPVDFSAYGKIYRSSSGESFSADDIKLGLVVGASPGPVFSNTFTYDPEAREPVSNSLSASWGPFSSSFTAKQSESYRPVSGTGWVGNDDEAFRSTEVSASLKPSFKSAAAQKDFVWSISPTLSLSQSLLQFSKSTLALGLAASVNVKSDLKLTVSAQSQNTSAWRYYPALFQDQLAMIPKEPSDFYVNPLEDLWDSISIWDTSALERGLIKLKSLSLEASGDLHDWTLTMKITASPKLDDDGKAYHLDTSFSFLLSWKDFSDIKAEITRDTEDGLAY